MSKGPTMKCEMPMITHGHFFFPLKKISVAPMSRRGDRKEDLA